MHFGDSFLSKIKSNKAIMLDKSRRFKKTSGSFDWSKSQQFDFQKATPQQLRVIKEKFRLENKRNRVKQLVIISITILLLATIILFFTQ